MTLRKALLAGAAVAGGATIAALLAATAPATATASASNTVFLAGAGLGGSGFSRSDTVVLAGGIGGLGGGTGVVQERPLSA